MTKLSFTKSEGNQSGPIKRDYKAVLDSAEIIGDVKQDRNGNPYATVKFSFMYDDDNKNTRDKAFITTLPYSLRDDSVASQILDLKDIHWSDMKDGANFDIDLGDFKALDCVIHVGGVRAEYDDKNGAFKEGQVKCYENQDGELKMSSEVIGVYPLAQYGKTWTDRMDEEQANIYEEFKSMKEAVGSKPATAEDMKKAFDV